VLELGGQVALLGIKHTSECVRLLRESGLSDARRSAAGFLFWCVGTWAWPTAAWRAGAWMRKDQCTFTERPHFFKHFSQTREFTLNALPCTAAPVR
jgi:hypothetical protein